MKKSLLILCLAISLCFTACSNETKKEENNLETSDSQSNENNEIVAAKANEITVMGQNVTAGMVLSEDLLASFGKENEILSAPSCHFDGEDTIYYYDDFNVYSYTDGDEQVIYLLELINDKISISSGVKIGMSKDEVISLQCDSYSELGLIVRYEIDGVYFDLSFDESDTLSLIEILID